MSSQPNHLCKTIVRKDMSMKETSLWGMTSLSRHRASSRRIKRKTRLTTKQLIRDILIVCREKKLEWFVPHSLQPFKCSLGKDKGIEVAKLYVIIGSVTSSCSVRRICVSNLENVKHLTYHDACWVFCQVLEATWQLWRTSGWVEVLTIGKNATRGNTCM